MNFDNFNNTDAMNDEEVNMEIQRLSINNENNEGNSANHNGNPLNIMPDVHHPVLPDAQQVGPNNAVGNGAQQVGPNNAVGNGAGNNGNPANNNGNSFNNMPFQHPVLPGAQQAGPNNDVGNGAGNNDNAMVNNITGNNRNALHILHQDGRYRAPQHYVPYEARADIENNAPNNNAHNMVQNPVNLPPIRQNPPIQQNVGAGNQAGVMVNNVVQGNPERREVIDLRHRGTRAGRNLRRHRLNPYEQGIQNLAMFFASAVAANIQMTRNRLQEERAQNQDEENSFLDKQKHA